MTTDAVTQDVATKYQRLIRSTQAENRIPALSVAIHRADRPLWTMQVGSSGTDRPLDAETQFRLGSVTKTFTAVLVMQCRDDGLLDLDDPIGDHVDVGQHSGLTIRRLISHTSGIQREPHGDVWDTLQAPDLDGLLADLEWTERVLPAGRRYHYSNLAVALLGYLVGVKRNSTWASVLQDRILTPLGLATVTVQPTGAAAVGYLVDAYSDSARAEEPVDTVAVAPAAQLWGAPRDLAKWAAFLADPATVDPDGAVLSKASVEEMRWPLTVTDEHLWAAGFGLGLLLQPQGDRVMHVGHDGAMPGFLAGVYGRLGGDAPDALGVAVLGSSGTAGAIVELPHKLLNLVVEADPAEIKPWVIADPVPADYRSILGRWWIEGSEVVLSWKDGTLQMRVAEDAAGRPPSVFAPIEGETDILRTVSGREAGERLRLTRDHTGAVIEMNHATYRLTRTQATFG
jgi:CubicO group peptidase (beta-lactamase class C family)